MRIKEFEKIVKKIFQKHLNNINNKINKDFTINGDHSFTDKIRIATTPDHYILELCGSTKYSKDEIIKVDVLSKEKFNNATSFVLPGERVDDRVEDGFCIKANNVGLTNLLIGTKYDKDFAKNIINILDTGANLKFINSDIPICVDKNADCVYLINIEILRFENIKIYYRLIPVMIIIKKETQRIKLIAWLEKIIQDNLSTASTHGSIIGLNIHPISTVLNMANQLYGLSNQHINERVLDKFIQNHKKHFIDIFNCHDLLDQRQYTLKWIKRNDGDPSESKPDYLIKNKDGYCDILDIKTGAVGANSIVKFKKMSGGGKTRMRFIDYVDELLAQLDDYKKYFNYKENREWAEQKYGIKVNNPRLIGIVGNYNNFENKDVSKILERYKNEIYLISYHDLANLLISKNLK